jgi:glyoxylase-like metal-dependent hydrolase (beta-lactamase superfamily II)
MFKRHSERKENPMAAPISGKQAPGYFRVKVGDYEVTVLSDGSLSLETALFAGDKAGAEKLLQDAHLPCSGIPTPLNVWVINTAGKLVLVDAGGGANFAPTVGRLPQNLAAAGIDPASIDEVVITHMHPDHIPGIVKGDGSMMFPNATVHVNGEDHGFWTSDEIRGKAPEEFRGFFDMAKGAIKPYAAAGKLQMYKDGTEFAPGVRSIFLPGHTVGHSMVRITSGRGDFLIFGDIVHCAALQFAEPERSVAFDTDAPLALSNRKKVFDMVATDKILFSGGHLPFPGVGRATKSGTGYTYVPVMHGEL